MDIVEPHLAKWKASLLSNISVGALLSRSPVAYKWKSCVRVWTLREAVFWRLHDLMTQSYELHKREQGLGARILLRSGFESLATLIYLNQLMRKVLDGTLNFNLFGDQTSILLLGSRNSEDGPRSLNITTVMDKCDKRYPGLKDLYADLSESAHPNFEGLCLGYSKVDYNQYETNFSNRWMALYGGRHLGAMQLCMGTFDHEYNNVWPALMEGLENWIVENDALLEAPKKD